MALTSNFLINNMIILLFSEMVGWNLAHQEPHHYVVM